MNTQQATIAWKQIPVMTKMACGAREQQLMSDGRLCFKVHSKPMRFVAVALNGGDLYDVEYFRLKRGSYERLTVETAGDVFCDDLGETIYRMVNK